MTNEKDPRRERGGDPMARETPTARERHPRLERVDRAVIFWFHLGVSQLLAIESCGERARVLVCGMWVRVSCEICVPHLAPFCSN